MLKEISFIRPILIILLVVYHAFIIYSGGWREPVGFVPNKIYWWIASIAYSFMLEMFVFISGYVWSYSIFYRSKVQSLLSLVYSKVKRLILPSVLFSTIYLFLLTDFEKCSFISILYQIIKGVGHMWFLPMLFWCFVFGALLNKLVIKDIYKLIILFVLSLMSFIPLPFQMGSSLYYLFFFYSGFIVKKKFVNFDFSIKRRNILFSWFLFVVAFVMLTLLNNKVSSIDCDSNLIFRVLRVIVIKFDRIVFSSLRILAMLFTAIYLTKKYELPQWVIKLGEYCFGVYLFQQFVLQLIYYHTQLPLILGPILLPWIATIITLVISIFLSYLLRMTRIGRAII